MVEPIDILAVLQSEYVQAGDVEPDPLSLRSLMTRYLELTSQIAGTDAELDMLEDQVRGCCRRLWAAGTISSDSRGYWLTDTQEQFARSQLKGRAVDIDDEGQPLSFREIADSMTELSRDDLFKLVKHAMDLLQNRV